MVHWENRTVEAVGVGLGIGASAAAVIAALWGLWRIGLGVWNRTLGRRHAQARILDQIACDVSLPYVESKIGVPIFITRPYGDEREERIYRLAGAWVAIEAKSDAVFIFSITITDTKMFYDISEMTLGNLKLKLGKDTFANVSSSLHDGEDLWYGSRHAGYRRSYYLGNPGGYQHYWLSYNPVGSGIYPDGWGFYSSGVYGSNGDKPPDPATITANTLTVLLHGTFESVQGRDTYGPHEDQLRLWAARKH